MPERVALKLPAACVLVIYGIYTGGYMTPVITVINTIANLLSCMEGERTTTAGVPSE